MCIYIDTYIPMNMSSLWLAERGLVCTDESHQGGHEHRQRGHLGVPYESPRFPFKRAPLKGI